MALDVYKDWLGIPDGPRPPDHYQLLRLVQFEDDAQKVQAHYRKLNSHVRKYASGQYSVQSQELLNELAKVMLCLTDPERKRTYDESLGREFAETVTFGAIPLEDVLVKEKHLTRAQVKEAQTFAEARGLSLRDAVVQMKLLEPDTAAKALAISLRLPYVDLADTLPDDSVLDQLPRKVVRRYSIIPLFVDDGMVLVACVDEPTHDLMEELQLRFGMPAKAVIATPLAINQAISKYYAPGTREEAVSPKTPKPDTKPAKSKKGAAEPKKPKEKKPKKIKEISGEVAATAGFFDILTLGLSWITIVALLVVPWFFPTWNKWLFYWTCTVAGPIVGFYAYKLYNKK